VSAANGAKALFILDLVVKKKKKKKKKRRRREEVLVVEFSFSGQVILAGWGKSSDDEHTSGSEQTSRVEESILQTTALLPSNWFDALVFSFSLRTLGTFS
jgi:hypothetical protein